MFKDLAVTFVSMTCDILNVVIFFYVILSFIVPKSNNVYRFMASLAEPILGSVRRLIPPVGMIDLSPIIVLFGLEMIKNILVALLLSI